MQTGRPLLPLAWGRNCRHNPQNHHTLFHRWIQQNAQTLGLRGCMHVLIQHFGAEGERLAAGKRRSPLM